MSARTRRIFWQNRSIDNNLLKQVAHSPKPSTVDVSPSAHAGYGASYVREKEEIGHIHSSDYIGTFVDEDPERLYNFSDVKIELNLNAIDLSDQQRLNNGLSGNKHFSDLTKHMTDYHVDKPEMESVKSGKKSSTCSTDSKLVKKKKARRTGAFKCEFCDQVYKCYFYMCRHMRNKHVKNLTKCKGNKASSKKIKAYVKKSIPYKCKVCGSIYSSPKSLSEHMKHVHSAKSSTKPKSIKDKSVRSKGLISLVKNTKSKTDANTSAKSLKGSKEKRAPDKENPSTRKKIVPSNGTLVHPKSGLSSPSIVKSPPIKNNTKLSEKKSHPIEAVFEKKEKKLKCKICQKIYSTRTGIMYHLKITHLYCSACYKQFCYQKVYDKHMELKHDQHHVIVDDDYFSNLSEANETTISPEPKNTKREPYCVDENSEDLTAEEGTMKKLPAEQNCTSELAVPSVISSLDTGHDNAIKIPEGTVLSPFKIRLNRLPSDPTTLKDLGARYEMVPTKKTINKDKESVDEKSIKNVVSSSPQDKLVSTRNTSENNRPLEKLEPKSKTQRSTVIRNKSKNLEMKAQPVAISNKGKVVKFIDKTGKCNSELSVVMEQASNLDNENMKTQDRSLGVRKGQKTNSLGSETKLKGNSQAVVNDHQIESMETNDLGTKQHSSCMEDAKDISMKQLNTSTKLSTLKCPTSAERVTRSSSKPDARGNTLSVKRSHLLPGKTFSSTRDIPTSELAGDENLQLTSDKRSSQATNWKDSSKCQKPIHKSMILTNSLEHLTSSSQSTHSTKHLSPMSPTTTGTTVESSLLTSSTRNFSLRTRKATSSESLQSNLSTRNPSQLPAAATNTTIESQLTRSEPSKEKNYCKETNRLCQRESDQSNTSANSTPETIPTGSFVDELSSDVEKNSMEHSTLHSRSKITTVYGNDIRELMFGKSCSVLDLHVDDKKSLEDHEDFGWKIVTEERSYDLNKLTLKITRNVKTGMRSVKTKQRFLCNLSGLKLKIVRDFSQQKRTVLSDEDGQCQIESDHSAHSTPQTIPTGSFIDEQFSDIENGISSTSHTVRNSLTGDSSSSSSNSDDSLSPRNTNVKSIDNVPFQEKLAMCDEGVLNSQRTQSIKRSDVKTSYLMPSDDMTKATNSKGHHEANSQEKTFIVNSERKLPGNFTVENSEKATIADINKNLMRYREGNSKSSLESVQTAAANLIGPSGDNVSNNTCLKPVVGHAVGSVDTSVSSRSVQIRRSGSSPEEYEGKLRLQSDASYSDVREEMQSANIKKQRYKDKKTSGNSIDQSTGLDTQQKSSGKVLLVPKQQRETDNHLTSCFNTSDNLLKQVKERGVARVMLEQFQDSVTLKETTDRLVKKRSCGTKLNKPAPACVKKRRFLDTASSEMMDDSEEHCQSEQKNVNITVPCETPVSSGAFVDEIDGECIRSPGLGDLPPKNLANLDTQDGHSSGNGKRVLMANVISQYMLEGFDESDLDLLLNESSGDRNESLDKDIEVILSNDGLYATVHSQQGGKNSSQSKGEVLKEIMGIIQFAIPGIFQTERELEKGVFGLDETECYRKLQNLKMVEEKNIVKSTHRKMESDSADTEQVKSTHRKMVSDSADAEQEHKDLYAKNIDSLEIFSSSDEYQNGNEIILGNKSISEIGSSYAGQNDCIHQNEESMNISEKEKKEISTPVNASLTKDQPETMQQAPEHKSNRKNAAADVFPSLPKCRECGNSFASVKSLESHKIKCLPEKFRKLQKYVCKLCGMMYAQKQNLKRHVKNRHSETLAHSLEAFSDICEVIDIDSDQSTNNHNSNDTYDINIQYRCLFCGIVYKKSSSVICHIESSHKMRDKRVSQCYSVENVQGRNDSSITQAERIADSSVEGSENLKIQSLNTNCNMDESETAVHNLLESFGEDVSSDHNKRRTQDPDVFYMEKPKPITPDQEIMQSSEIVSKHTGPSCQEHMGKNFSEEVTQIHHQGDLHVNYLQDRETDGNLQNHGLSEKILQEVQEHQREKAQNHQRYAELECHDNLEQEGNKHQKVPDVEGKALVETGQNSNILCPLSESTSPETSVQCSEIEGGFSLVKENGHNFPNTQDPVQYMYKSDDVICEEVAHRTGFTIHRNSVVRIVRLPSHTLTVDSFLKPESSGENVSIIKTSSGVTESNHVTSHQNEAARPLSCEEDHEHESVCKSIRETLDPVLLSALVTGVSKQRFVCNLCGLSYASKTNLKRHSVKKHLDQVTSSGEALKVIPEESNSNATGISKFSQIQTIKETTRISSTEKSGKTAVISSAESEDQIDLRKSKVDITDGSRNKETSTKQEGQLMIESNNHLDFWKEKLDNQLDIQQDSQDIHSDDLKDKMATQPVLNSTIPNTHPFPEASGQQLGKEKKIKESKHKKDKEKSKSKQMKVKIPLTGKPVSHSITEFEMAISTPVHSQRKLKKRKLDRQTSTEEPSSKRRSSTDLKTEFDKTPQGDTEEKTCHEEQESFQKGAEDVFSGDTKEIGDGHLNLCEIDTEIQSGSETPSRKSESPKKPKKSIDKIVQGIIQRHKDMENKKNQEKLNPPEVDFPAPFEEILAQCKSKATKSTEVSESTGSLNDENSKSQNNAKSSVKPIDIVTSIRTGPSVKFGKSFRKISQTASTDDERQFRSPLDRVRAEVPMKFGATQERMKAGEATAKPIKQSNKNYLIDILKDIPSIYDFSNEEGRYISPWDNPTASKAEKSIMGGTKPSVFSKTVHFDSDVNNGAPNNRVNLNKMSQKSVRGDVREISNEETAEEKQYFSSLSNEDDNKLTVVDGEEDENLSGDENDSLRKNNRWDDIEPEDDQGSNEDEEDNENKDSDNHRNTNGDKEDDDPDDEDDRKNGNDEQGKDSDSEMEEEEFNFLSPSEPPLKHHEKNGSDEERDILSIDYDSDEASFLDDVRSVTSRKSVTKRRSLAAVESELEAIEVSSVAASAMDLASESSLVQSKIQCNPPPVLTPAVVSKAAKIFLTGGGYCYAFLLHGYCRRKDICRYQHTIPPLEWFFRRGQATILDSREKPDIKRAFEVYHLLKTLNVRPITRDTIEVLLKLAVNSWDTDAAFQLFGDMKATDLINDVTSMMLVRLCSSSPQNYIDQLWALFQVVLEKNLKLSGDCMDTIVQAFSMRRDYTKLLEVLYYSNKVPDYVVPVHVLHMLLTTCLKFPEEYLPAITKWAETCNQNLLRQLEPRILVDLYDTCVKHSNRVLGSLLERLNSTILPVNQGEPPETTDILAEQDWNGDRVGKNVITSSDEYKGRQHRIRGCKLTKNWEHLGSIFVELCCDLELSNPYYIEEYIYVLTDSMKPETMAENFKLFLQAIHKEMGTKMADNMDVLDEPSLARIGAGLLQWCYKKGQWEQGYRLLFVMHQAQVYYYKCNGNGTIGTALIAMEICLNTNNPDSALQILERSKGQILISENSANVTRILNNLFDKLLEKSYTKMAFTVLVIFVEKQEQDQTSTDLSLYFNCLIQKSLLMSDIHTALGVFKIQKKTGSGKLSVLCLRGLLTACGKHMYDNKYIEEVYESCIAHKLYPPHTFDMPRSILLSCMMTPVEMYLYISDYLNLLYNSVCDSVMEGVHLTMDHFHLSIHVWWEEDRLQQLNFPYLSLAPHTRQQVWQMALYVLHKDINPPLKGDYNSASNCIFINPESLHNYLQVKDGYGRKQGLHIQASTVGPVKMRGRAWARPNSFSNGGRGRPYR